MQPVAVLVIHGMGRHAKAAPDEPRHLSFADPLYRALIKRLGSDAAPHVVLRETFWADILQTRQDALTRAMEQVLPVGPGRRLMLSYIGDGANFQYSPRPDSTYQKVHQRIEGSLRSLAAVVDPATPLVILAHSLGGHMVSTYLWDRNKTPAPDESATTAFLRGATLANFVTFGCNIPIFAFGHHDICAINPRTWATAGHLRPTWWDNFYTRADFLSFPLATTGGDYARLADASGPEVPQLVDHPIRVGGLLTSWNIAAHARYWDAPALIDPVAEHLRVQIDR